MLASKDSTMLEDGFEFVDAIYAASPCELILCDVLKRFSLGVTFWLFRAWLTDAFDIISETFFS